MAVREGTQPAEGPAARKAKFKAHLTALNRQFSECVRAARGPCSGLWTRCSSRLPRPYGFVDMARDRRPAPPVLAPSQPQGERCNALQRCLLGRHALQVGVGAGAGQPGAALDARRQGLPPPRTAAPFRLPSKKKAVPSALCLLLRRLSLAEADVLLRRLPRARQDVISAEKTSLAAPAAAAAATGGAAAGGGGGGGGFGNPLTLPSNWARAIGGPAAAANGDAGTAEKAAAAGNGAGSSGASGGGGGGSLPSFGAAPPFSTAGGPFGSVTGSLFGAGGGGGFGAPAAGTSTAKPAAAGAHTRSCMLLCATAGRVRSTSALQLRFFLAICRERRRAQAHAATLCHSGRSAGRLRGRRDRRRPRCGDDGGRRDRPRLRHLPLWLRLRRPHRRQHRRRRRAGGSAR